MKFYFTSLLLFLSCNVPVHQDSPAPTSPDNQQVEDNVSQKIIDTAGYEIISRFNPPTGFKRIELAPHTFGHFLRNHPLRKHGSLVHYYDGTTKPPDNVYCAVVDQTISPRDLQQCADAVMRMRGEFLFNEGKYDQIHFNFLSDGKPRYYKNYTSDLSNKKRFLKYMDWIFAFANTESLGNELKSKNLQDILPGDVFITVNRGTIGHAVMVMDVAIDDQGRKAFILAQSYMPAQETQVLLNPSAENSPWYYSDETPIYTPEWTFTEEDLKTFGE